MVMAKGIIQTAADAVKTVAGAAIGAAAAAATTVVVESVANSIKGRKKEYQAPAVESAVRLAIASPPQSKSARKRKAPVKNKKATAAKIAKKSSSARKVAVKKKMSSRKRRSRR
jgi:hypothetical protein